MMIWDLIRDWFVQYIWGGVTANGGVYYAPIVGNIYEFNLESSEIADDYVATSNEIFLPIGSLGNNVKYYLTIGDWLSTTSTIIVLVLLLIAFVYLIVNLFKMFSNIFSLKR